MATALWPMFSGCQYKTDTHRTGSGRQEGWAALLSHGHAHSTSVRCGENQNSALGRTEPVVVGLSSANFGHSTGRRESPTILTSGSVQSPSKNQLRTMHASYNIFLAVGILFVGVLRAIRCRNAKARGLSPAQFALENGASVQKLLATGKQMRWLGRILFVFPFVLGVGLAIHPKSPSSVLAAEFAALVVIFGVLGLLFLWVARKNEALAREIERLPSGV